MTEANYYQKREIVAVSEYCNDEPNEVEIQDGCSTATAKAVKGLWLRARGML